MQTTYPLEQRPAMKGMLVNISPHTIDTLLAEGPNIIWGRAVMRGTAEDQGKAPTAAGQAFRGIALRDDVAGLTPSGVDGKDFYKATEAINLLRKGRAWVEVTEAVAEGAAAFVVYAAGADNGKFAAAAVALTSEAVPAIFRSATTGPGLADLEVNLP